MKLLVFVPTYNERANIEPLCNAIKRQPFTLDILFCDDNSPDGTGTLLDTLAANDPSIKVIHRSGKLGLGTATKQAFDYAIKHGYEFLLTMDADLTHDPAYIPALIGKRHEADIVIGSRYAQGGSMKGWSIIRLPFTYFWRSMIRWGIGLPCDATGAFRLYRVPFLAKVDLHQISSRGFCFGLESLYYCKLAGARIEETPIIAHSRVAGKSKLSVRIMTEFAAKYLQLTFDRCMRYLHLKKAPAPRIMPHDK
jgi:dolichol-phosphate mannosyltransferase